MKYQIRKSLVWIVGKIWLPPVICGQQLTLTDHDLENCKGDDGKITRESLEQWLMTHTGDFQSILDFRASLEVGPDTIDIPWANEESEFTYCDSVYSGE